MEEIVKALVKRIRKLETKDPGPAIYMQTTDPGAVGAYSLWLDTSTDTLYYRDPTDTSWISISGGGGGGMANPMTTLGDIIVAIAAGAPDRLGIGAAGEVLTVSGGTPSWEPLPVDPLLDHSHTAPGDGGNFDADILNSGAATDGQVLTADGASGAAWEDLPAAGNHDILSATHDDTTVSAPNDQDVLTWDDATSKWIAQAPAGGGATIYTSAYASPPAGPASGDLWLPSDGVSLYRYSGAAWVPWGEINALAGVANAPTTWVNQGTASVDSTYGGVYLTAPATAGNYNFRMQVKAAPATPYTITALIKPSIESVNFNGAGLVWRQSSDGKLVNAGFIWSSAMNFYIAKWSDPNTWAGNYIYPTSYHMGWPWIRLTDNGTNRIISVSIDGRHWHQLHSVGRTDYLTANQVGFYVMTQSTYPVGALLLSWEET